MNRRVAFPFLTLSDEAIITEPWSLSLNGEDWQPAGSFLRDWDPASKICMRRTLRVDADVAASELDIDSGGLRLALGVRVGTGPGRLPRLIVHRESRPLAHGEREKLDLEVSGDQLSLVLDVQTQVLLAGPPHDPGPLSPQRVRSRLWVDSLLVRLEGEDPRFPMEVVDLQALLNGGTGAAAPWFLHWSPGDWNRDFQGAARLYLNKGTPAFKKKIVEEQDGPSLQVLLADVMGQICERLLSDPDAENIMAEAEPGSIAAQATTWLGRVWPEKDADFLRSVLRRQPGRFRAAFLELAELREA
ncbi:MAG: hypothetical protein F4Y41_20430 [Gammaproteobacteria bacterium]|nr:hypothetical protein [Gammaproteobacteria bacterium]